MNDTEARTYIEELNRKKGSVPGLDAIRELLKRLGNPQDRLRILHIAGTNGKGSVLSCLTSILTEAGFKTGSYTSPALFSYRERFRINQKNISEEDFAALVEKVRRAAEEMERDGKGSPTAFEVETAAAYLYFQENQCEFAVVEAGMGGRLDATNCITSSVLSVLVSVSMDHMQFLGNSLEEIAWQKAGILKPGVPALCGILPEEAAAVVRKEAKEQGVPLTFLDPEKIRDRRREGPVQSFVFEGFGRVEISLAGSFQIYNAALALEAALLLRRGGVALEDGAILSGLKKARWRGRFDLISREPAVVLDGAHNPDAARKLMESAEEYFPGRKKYYIFGVFSDKEYDKIIDVTAKKAEKIFTVETPGNPRALPAQTLAQAVKRVNPSVEAVKSIPDAVEKCFAQASQKDVILIFGSLSFLDEAQKAVARYKDSTGR